MFSLVVKLHEARGKGTGQILKDDFLSPLKVEKSDENVVYSCIYPLTVNEYYYESKIQWSLWDEV